MEFDRGKLDNLAFLGALAALGFAALVFVGDRNGAAVVMCGICLAGLVGGRLVGVSGLSLLPVAVGVAGLLYIVWIDPPGGPRETSAFAHGVGGMLAGWALAVTLRQRVSWPAWALLALLSVVTLTLVWEFGEYLGDRALDTALIPSKRDSALDIFFGSLGGTAAVAAVALFDPRGRRAR